MVQAKIVSTAVAASASDVPIIDLAPLGADDPGGRAPVASEIGQACRDIGFFYVRNHGIDEQVLTRAFAAMHWFFALPMADKLALKRTGEIARGYIPANDMDGRRRSTLESFVLMADLPADDPDVLAGIPMYGANRWPTAEGDVQFRADMTAYLDAVMALAYRLLDAFALSLGLPGDRLARHYEKPLINLQLNRYPSNAAEMGTPPHRDTGGFTILATDDVGGLELKGPDDTWISAPYVPGAIIVNVANMLSVQTNGLFRSIVHQVINSSGKERYSLPLFMNPSWSAVVSPEPEFVSADNPAQVEPIEFGPWFNKVFYGSRYNDRADVRVEVV